MQLHRLPDAHRIGLSRLGSGTAAVIPSLERQLKTYVKTADSGAKRIHAFCANCGTPVYACAAVGDPPSYSLRVGCLKQRALLPPKKRIWCRSALGWAQDVSSVPAIDHQ